MSMNGRCGDDGGCGEGVSHLPPHEILKNFSFQQMREALDQILKALMAMNLKRDKTDEATRSVMQSIKMHKQRVQRLLKRLKNTERRIEKFEKLNKLIKKKRKKERRIALRKEQNEMLEEDWKQPYFETEEEWRDLQNDDGSWSLSLLKDEETLESLLLSSAAAAEVPEDSSQMQDSPLSLCFFNRNSFLSNSISSLLGIFPRPAESTKSCSSVSQTITCIPGSLDAPFIQIDPPPTIASFAMRTPPSPSVPLTPTSSAVMMDSPDPNALSPRSASSDAIITSTRRGIRVDESHCDPRTPPSPPTPPTPSTLSALVTPPEPATRSSSRSVSTTTSTNRTSTSKYRRLRTHLSRSVGIGPAVPYRPGPPRIPTVLKRRDALGRNLLNAVQDGEVRSVWRYLRNGADVNYRNVSRWTPLHMAAKRAQANIVALLLEFGANVHARTAYGFTPLHMTAYNDHEGICMCMLINAGARLNTQNFSGRTPLHCAAEIGNTTTVRILVLAGANRSIKNDIGRTPFCVAKSPCVRNYLLYEY